jgi:biopolymer transport protein ExbD
MSFASTPPETNYGWRPPTTYVDVMFLILTFFITIAAFRDDDRQINVALPAQEAAKAGGGGRTQIVVTVTRDEQIFLGDRLFTPETLLPKLTELAVLYPNESVVIRADRESRLGMTVKVMDLAYKAGLKDVSLGTIKPRKEVGE